ncbi:hypothetical protein HDU79_003586 [Rhizoclosmatium sp. JEL0117]|nr:hypothetical protein HDU79_003586 [Rhizoclosmatium sp. JEL0117]
MFLVNHDTVALPQTREPRKLIVCVDGTSQTPGSVSDIQSMGHIKVTAAMTPSNVVKLAYLAAQHHKEGAEQNQKVYYHSGPGTEVSDSTEASLEDMYGNIKGHVMDAYAWLAKEYQEGDEIYAFGFSRGATIVRSLFSLIREAGLPIATEESAPTPDSFLGLVNSTFKVYETRLDKSNVLKTSTTATTSTKSVHVPVAPPVDPSKLHPKVNLKFIGVFDTVEALDVPEGFVSFVSSKWLTKIQEEIGVIEPNDYHDLTIGNQVQYAYHALSMDEKRSYFPPTLFEAPPADLPAGFVREQKWFRGDHADIGGGWWEQGLANIALNWMIEKARLAGLEVQDQAVFEKAFSPFLLGASPEALAARDDIKLHDYFATLPKEDNSMMGRKVSRDLKAFKEKVHTLWCESSFHESVEQLKDRIAPALNWIEL